ncbi:MAG: IgGFc-binding protein [Verrucomicrobiales bacterium]
MWKDDAGSVIHPAGVFYNINLNKGQTYQLAPSPHGPADLSGTLIQSNLPIGCYGGHRCTQINANGTFFCDTAVEMLLPVNAWGSQYCTVPLATRAGGDTIRAIAAMDNTTIRVNGAVKGVINRGQVLEWLEPNPAEITGVGATGGALPILVAQYANSHDYDGVVDSDPFMAMVQRSDSWMSDYCICAPPHSRFQDNYVNLIVPDQAQVLVIGEQGNLDISLNYSTHPCRGYRYARLKLPSTSNSFIAADAPFGLMQYGWAEYESVAIPGRCSSAIPPTLICPPEIVVYCDVDANGECYLRQIPDLRDQVQAFDDCDPFPPVIGQINPQQPSDNGFTARQIHHHLHRDRLRPKHRPLRHHALRARRNMGGAKLRRDLSRSRANLDLGRQRRPRQGRTQKRRRKIPRHEPEFLRPPAHRNRPLRRRIEFDGGHLPSPHRHARRARHLGGSQQPEPLAIRQRFLRRSHRAAHPPARRRIRPIHLPPSHSAQRRLGSGRILRPPKGRGG